MNDREHQLLVRQRFADIAAGRITDEKTVVDVCPGGGKSRNVRIAVDELDKAKLAGGLIWLVPRASLAAQSRRSFNKPGCPFQLGTVGLQLRNRWGYVATYQKFCSFRAAAYAKEVARNLQGRPGIVLMVLDELHHCTGDLQRAWSSGVDQLRRALEANGIRLHIMNMTGTLFRGDGQPILYVDYADGHAVTHIRYGVIQGNEEGAVVPAEVAYVDGPVVIRSSADNDRAYKSMTEVPATHRSKVRKAFMVGQIPQSVGDPSMTDGRQYTALWLLKYGLDHYVQQRKEWDYPLQTIVVASSAATAMGYTSWLRQHYPDLRIGVSLSNDEASRWGSLGFKGVKAPFPVIVDLDGEENPVGQTCSVNGSSETSGDFWSDFQLIVNGMPAGNYRRLMNRMKDSLTDREEEEFNMLPVGEKIIRGFQADPIDGENVIDVLVTVGKAYEGLDAPRCKHLICLTRQRSAPWLAQCFARAWRRDYNLQNTRGITDQRCWIFAPRDAEMLDAVDRIVWDQDLAPVVAQPATVEDLQLEPEEVLDEDQLKTYEELKVEWLAHADEAEPDDDGDEDVIFFPSGDDAADGTTDSPTAGDGDDDGDDEQQEPKKVKPPARAFSVIDRVVHEFVDYQQRRMVVLKDEKVVPVEAYAQVVR
jgi:superfamily II DNA or RNA helicase